VVHVVRCSFVITEQFSRVSIIEERREEVVGGTYLERDFEVEGNLELKLKRRKLGEQTRQDFVP
jgi:hypothetical protein